MLNNNKKLTVVLMLLFSFSFNESYSMLNNAEEYSGENLYATTQKTIKKFSSKCFFCCLKSQKNADEKSLIKYDHLSFTHDIAYEYRLEQIPIEIFYLLCRELSPLDVIHFFNSTKHLKKNLNAQFWEDYIIMHNQQKWDLGTPAIKVAFSYSLFEKRKIAEAAKLGLPSAIILLNKTKMGTYIENRLPRTNRVADKLKERYAF